VAVPSSQQSKGYTFVNFEWTLLLRTGGSEWGRRVTWNGCFPGAPAGENFRLSRSV